MGFREIIFKAKRIDNGEWVEGFVFNDGIIDSKRMFVGMLVITDYKGTANDRWDVGTYFYEVDPSTICQYTGLCDKNGRKIFENDIVQRYNEYVEETWRSVVKYGEFNCSCCNGVYGWVFDGSCDIRGYDECEVVGNIFDNADLLKETVIEDEEPSEYVEQDTKCDLCKYNGECESKIEITKSRDTRAHYIRWFNEYCKLESEESDGTSKI